MFCTFPTNRILITVLKILIYRRASVRPTHDWPIRQKLFTLDVLYFPDKPNPDNCPQDVSDECSEISLCAATESTRGTSEKLLPAPKTFLITSLKSYLAQSTFTLFKKYYLISPHTPSTAMLLLISRNRVRGHCVDEIHTVVSAFHTATELDPQLHTRFALQTISYLYKNLRERISKKILMMGSGFRERQREVSRRLNLPPALPSSAAKTYPKDSEKHLLAIRSGFDKKSGIKLVYKCAGKAMEADDRRHVRRNEQEEAE
ncbi:hypothetical protein F2Q68_00028979 [Brassica cretica]|uniref:POX domain-containing protein n=1 Tax=Brassica cretica TaxID=69181 RepID=A0A8S9GEV5_BRACR|nr:hypothetical protein F2Q68_00028979 [Brassica cretica]